MNTTTNNIRLLSNSTSVGVTGVRRLAILILVCVGSACANLNSIHRKTHLNERVDAISIDAKQRFMVSSVITEQNVDNNGTTSTTNFPVVCTEPSPDAFSVFSSAIEASADKSDALSAAFKAAMGESGATLGIRTESVQLLRDAMYRLCEAFAGGGLSVTDYTRMISKYQKSMITLIAISQLTGAIRPPQVVLHRDANLGESSLLATAHADHNKAKKTAEEAEKKHQEVTQSLENSVSELGGDFEEMCKTPEQLATEKCQKHTSLKEQHAVTEGAEKIAKEDLAKKAKQLESAQQLFTLSTSSESTVAAVSAVQIPKESIETLAKTVQSLVEDVFLVDAVDTCLEGVLELSGLNDEDHSTNTKTAPVIQLTAEQEKENQKARDAFVKYCLRILTKEDSGQAAAP